MFLIFHVVLCDHVFKGYVTLWVEARYGNSIICHVWWPLV